MHKLIVVALIAVLTGMVAGCSGTTGPAKSPAEVESTSGKYSYSPESQVFTAELARGTYIYKGVPPEVYADFMNAPSLGSAYNTLIRGKYESVKVE